MPICEGCVKGTIHAGQPTGTIETLHGLTTYITGNRTSPRATIILYSDIFGLNLPNNKLLADAYAKSGEYLVYLPDFFKGDPAPIKIADRLIPAVEGGAWKKYTGILAALPSVLVWQRRHPEAATSKMCVDFLTKLRNETPRDRKIGMVGTCWGGRYAMRAARESEMIQLEGGSEKVPLVDAVVALHPSNLVLPADTSDFVVPVSIGWGETDIAVKIEQMHQIKDMYAQAAKAGKKVPEMEHKVYTPGRHGFAVRGNPDDPAERKALENSVTQVLEWFGKWL